MVQQDRTDIGGKQLSRKGIAKGLSRGQHLKEAIDKLKKDHPKFEPMFDEDFFKIPKKGFLQN